MKVRFGVIASLSGINKKTGKGYIKSAEYVIERRIVEFKKLGYELELVVKDDKNDSRVVEELAIDLLKQDCIAILCPTDTESTYQILKSEKVNDIPLICSFSTASFLSTQGKTNFFRFTTPDSIRAEILVRYVKKLYPGKFVYTYALVDSEYSYSQQLSHNVIESLDKYAIKWARFSFNKELEEIELPEKGSPVVICSPSYFAVKLTKKLRNTGFNNQIFTFGSNSNLLQRKLEGCIIVCDLDREDSNPIAREELDYFNKLYKDQHDPSISTINAMHSILNSLKEISTSEDDIEVPQLRFLLKNHLRSKTSNGLFGPVSFSNEGEMAGHEHISVMRVSINKRKILFLPVNMDEKAYYYKNISLGKWPILILYILGSIASIVSLIVWFF